jgi:hypothetical protein
MAIHWRAVKNSLRGTVINNNLLKSLPIYGKNDIIELLLPERTERGGPCWLVKLRQMGTQRVHMKGGFLWLVHWPRRVGTITSDIGPALAALVSQLQNTFSLTVLFHFICYHRPASWAGSLDASPVFYYASLVTTVNSSNCITVKLAGNVPNKTWSVWPGQNLESPPGSPVPEL